MEQKKTAETTKKETAKMYIGPTFKGVAYASVYTNGLPSSLKEKAGQHPVFKELIVDLGDLAMMQAERKNPESAISKCFKEAEKIIAEGEK